MQVDRAMLLKTPPPQPMGGQALTTQIESSPAIDLDRNATAADLHRAGIACSTGIGAPLDYVEAHKWFNLAALAGVQEAKAHRRELAALMSPAEVAAAQAGARAWLASAALGHTTGAGGEPQSAPAQEIPAVGIAA
jgi:TPR repeat protein